MATFDNFLPEIFPIVAAHLPLRSTSSTLLALALTNHRISKIVLPLVPSCIILGNEAVAIRVLRRLLDDPKVGHGVRELHIASELSEETRNAAIPCDTVRLLEKAILEGRLPFLRALSLYIMEGWYVDSQNTRRITGHGYLRFEVWTTVKTQHCPCLRSLTISGFSDYPEDPWIADSGILEVPVGPCQLGIYRMTNGNDEL